MRLRWLPWRRHVDTTEQARAAYAELEENDAKVEKLGERLRAARRANHFSEMVNAAIERKRES